MKKLLLIPFMVGALSGCDTSEYDDGVLLGAMTFLKMELTERGLWAFGGEPGETITEYVEIEKPVYIEVPGEIQYIEVEKPVYIDREVETIVYVEVPSEKPVYTDTPDDWKDPNDVNPEHFHQLAGRYLFNNAGDWQAVPESMTLRISCQATSVSEYKFDTGAIIPHVPGIEKFMDFSLLQYGDVLYFRNSGTEHHFWWHPLKPYDYDGEYSQTLDVYDRDYKAYGTAKRVARRTSPQRMSVNETMTGYTTWTAGGVELRRKVVVSALWPIRFHPVYPAVPGEPIKASTNFNMRWSYYNADNQLEAQCYSSGFDMYSDGYPFPSIGS